jgi:hypothetical protein
MMSVTVNGNPLYVVKPNNKKLTHASRKMPAPPLAEEGETLCVGNLLYIFDIASSTLYDRLRHKECPPPDGCDETRHPFWKRETIRGYQQAGGYLYFHRMRMAQARARRKSSGHTTALLVSKYKDIQGVMKSGTDHLGEVTN